MTDRTIVAIVDMTPAAKPKALIRDPAVRAALTEVARAARGRSVRLEFDDAGNWRSDGAPECAVALQRAFTADYLPRASYHPAGRLAAIADEAADLLGGRLILAGFVDLTPPGAVN